MSDKPRNPYEARQVRRQARLEAAADRADTKADAARAKADRIHGRIEPGQPILVGHHSERRHRRDLETAHKALGQSFAERERAEELRRKADAVGTAGVSSDDPEAIQKLEEELARKRLTREAELTANIGVKRAVAAVQKATGRDPNLDEKLAIIRAIDVPDSIKKRLESYARAFPGCLPRFGTNTATSVRRLEERLKELRARDEAPNREPIVGEGWRIEENREANRVQIRFDAKPDEAKRKLLKSWGFRWAPSEAKTSTESVWQRQLNNASWHAARCVMGVSS